MLTIVRRLRFLILSPILAALCGCTINLASLTGSGAKPSTDYTGNYALAGAPGASGQLPGPVEAFLGSVTNVGAAFSGTFRLVTTNGCVSPTADLAVTGSMDSTGQITLTSTTLPNNTVSVTWLDDPTQSSNGVGTYTITGSGPCAMPATQFVSDSFSPVTGTYTGTFTSGYTTATVTATLAQGAANADGQFPETGTLVLSTPTCTNNFTVSGVVTGPTMTVTFNPSGGTSLGGFAATLPDHALTLTLPAGLNVLGACNAGTFSGQLVKQ